MTNESQKTKKRKKKPLKEEEEEVEPEAPPSEEIHLRLSRGLPSHQPIEVRVIVYVIRVSFRLTGRYTYLAYTPSF